MSQLTRSPDLVLLALRARSRGAPDLEAEAVIADEQEERGATGYADALRLTAAQARLLLAEPLGEAGRLEGIERERIARLSTLTILAHGIDAWCQGCLRPHPRAEWCRQRALADVRLGSSNYSTAADRRPQPTVETGIAASCFRLVASTLGDDEGIRPYEPFSELQMAYIATLLVGLYGELETPNARQSVPVGALRSPQDPNGQRYVINVKMRRIDGTGIPASTFDLVRARIRSAVRLDVWYPSPDGELRSSRVESPLGWP